MAGVDKLLPPAHQISIISVKTKSLEGKVFFKSIGSLYIMIEIENWSSILLTFKMYEHNTK